MTAGKGALTLVEQRRAGFGLGPNSAPKNDWQQARFGADAPATSIQLWESAMLAVMAALGVPPSLYTSQGGALRESYRHLFGSLMEPLGQLIAAELSEKLEEKITIKWPERLKSDISALSRGFSSLVKDGYPLEQVHEMLGFPAMRRRSQSLNQRLLRQTQPLSLRHLDNRHHLLPLVAQRRTGGHLWYSRGNSSRRY